MSLQDQNNMLYILHRNGVSREGVLFIMNNLKKTSVFDDFEEENNFDDWDFMEEQAYWLFDSDVSNAKKLKALKSLKVRQEEYDKIKRSRYFLDQEKRILAKRKELIEKGVIKPDPPSPKKPFKTTTRYGRSPLHEAIAMRDIRLVEKYLKRGKYLDKTDNNGHIAMEMAYYEDYQESLILFEKYKNSKK